jgi:hypothetical protein
MQPTVALIWLTLAAVPLPGEGRGSWEDVLGLKPGRKVQIVLTNMTSYQGRLVSVSDSSISIEVRQNSMRFERENVHRVTRRGSRGKNTLRGAAVGGLTGFVIGSIEDRGPSESGEGDLGKKLFGGIGLLVGTGIGAAVPTGSTVFRSHISPVNRRTAGSPEKTEAGSRLQMEGLNAAGSLPGEELAPASVLLP